MSRPRLSWLSRQGMAALDGAGRTVATALLSLCVMGGGPSAASAAPAPCEVGGVGRDSFCTVNGARLHFVDWGGKGPPLILLAGLSNSARIFDDFAPSLTATRHVYAFTRRGFGLSEATAGGYDADGLGTDIIDLMDALGIESADLVGHSIAGEELTRVAATHPNRVRRLVYLDAAYDRTEVADLEGRDPIGSRAPPISARRSWRRLIAWKMQLLGSRTPAIAADLKQTFAPGPDGLLAYRTPPFVTQAVVLGDRAARPDYRRLQAPALAIYAPKTKLEQAPPSSGDAVRSAELAFSLTVVRPWMLREKARFQDEIACGRAIEAPQTGHYLFLERPKWTAERVRDFIDSANPCG